MAAAGDDMIDGCDGKTPSFYDRRSDYTIVENQDGSFTITDYAARLPTAPTRFSNVENFQFAEQHSRLRECRRLGR